MTSLHEMEEHVKKAIGQVGAQFKYLEEEISWLLKLEKDFDDYDKAKDDAGKVYSLFRTRIVRTERRVNRPEQKIEEDMEELAKYLPAKLLEHLTSLGKKIHKEAQVLFTNLSRSRESLMGKIKKLKDDVTGLKENPQNKPIVLQEVKDLLTKVKKVDEFVKGFQVSAGKYQEFLKYLEKI